MAVFTQAAKTASSPSRLASAARTVGVAVRGAAARLAAPHRAAVANLLHIPFTAAGAGCIDYAAFHVGSGWGWLCTGISLILVELIIADER